MDPTPSVGHVPERDIPNRRSGYRLAPTKRGNCSGLALLDEKRRPGEIAAPEPECQDGKTASNGGRASVSSSMRITRFVEGRNARRLDWVGLRRFEAAASADEVPIQVRRKGPR
jgi:hypothetical protein